jgi:serine/threonine protein kinase
LVADWILPKFPSGFEKGEKIRGGWNSKIRIWKHQETGQCVVVKEPVTEEDADSRSQRMVGIFREIEGLIELEHPCIVPLCGVVLPTAETELKIATEYIDGGSLKTVLRAARQPKVPSW